jgi:predicted negative regulator of RcsB-dependent stress response
MTAQITESADVVKHVGDTFGFAALVAFILLLGIGYFAFRAFDTWSKNQERKTGAEIVRNDLVAEAQNRSYERHIEFASNTQLAVSEITRATSSIGRAIELMASSSSGEYTKLADVHTRTEQMHRAARQTLLVLADALFDKPEAQKALRDIAKGLD